jgi:hypothetical protein
MIYYGYAAIWDSGVNLGYSKSLMDIAQEVADVGLAGQNEMKVGTINNIDAFRDLFEIDLLPSIQSTDNPEDGQVIDLDIVYIKACKLIDLFRTEDFHSCYIEREGITRFHNHKQLNLPSESKS